MEKTQETCRSRSADDSRNPGLNGIGGLEIVEVSSGGGKGSEGTVLVQLGGQGGGNGFMKVVVDGGISLPNDAGDTGIKRYAWQ